MIQSILRFFGSIFKKIFKFVIGAVKDIVTNAQAVIILVCASIGLTALLKELPFHVALPAIVDGIYFIPVVSVMIIFLLAWTMTLGGDYAEASI
jgi:cellulose synthase/poly-beta-1,6-N-acetylglucosamine synthase-like glycosyltransferase